MFATMFAAPHPRTPTAHRRTAATLALALGLTALLPTVSLASQEEPSVSPTPSAPTTTPGRTPTYGGPTAVGAMRVPGSPPEIGDVIVEDSLAGQGALLGSIACPSGQNRGEFVGEGYILKVAGRCVDGQGAFLVTPPISGLAVPDGEIRLEAKVVSGHERAVLLVLFRSHTDPPEGYTMLIRPAAGAGQVSRTQGQTASTLAARSDLAGRVSRDGWNSLAVRLDGPNIWVLLNDEPILSTTDSMIDSGSVRFGVARVGNPDDNVESAAVFRNLRVSSLAPRP